jgi:hypothetical protein
VPAASGEEELLGGGRRPRRIVPLGWAAVLVLATLVATGVWYHNRADRAIAVSYSGSTVDNAHAVISGADAAFVRYVRDHHGARSEHARCYFNQVGGRAGTDVSATVFCGPVLFYGGAAPAMYLRYPLSPSGAAVHNHLRLQLGDLPASATPQSLPVDARLERPDGRTLPEGADGVVPPPPPPAPFYAVVRVNGSDLPRLSPAPDTATIGSRNVQVTMRASGFVPYYGHDAHARSAPPGQRLLGFQLQIGQGEIGSLNDAEQPVRIGLALDDGSTRALPLALGDMSTNEPKTRFVVAAVPADARTADLVVRDAGITQRLSILTGVPGKDNIAVLARPATARHGKATSTGRALAKVDASGRQSRTRLTLLLSGAHLGYFSFYGPEHASAPDRALLGLDLYYQIPDDPCPGSACADMFGAKNLVLLPDGGAPIRAHEFTGHDVEFDVPATFHSGTVIISGASRTWSGRIVTLIRPYRVRVSFPN